MSTLKQVSKLVKMVLDQDEKARNSDNYLYYRILGIQGKERGIDIDAISLPMFFKEMSDFGFAPFETVRRTRQKIQHDFPELRAKDEVVACRAEKETEFRAYARGGACG